MSTTNDLGPAPLTDTTAPGVTYHIIRRYDGKRKIATCVLPSILIGDQGKTDIENIQLWINTLTSYVKECLHQHPPEVLDALVKISHYFAVDDSSLEQFYLQYGRGEGQLLYVPFKIDFCKTIIRSLNRPDDGALEYDIPWHRNVLNSELQRYDGNKKILTDCFNLENDENPDKLLRYVFSKIAGISDPSSLTYKSGNPFKAILNYELSPGVLKAAYLLLDDNDFCKKANIAITGESSNQRLARSEHADVSPVDYSKIKTGYYTRYEFAKILNIRRPLFSLESKSKLFFLYERCFRKLDNKASFLMGDLFATLTEMEIKNKPKTIEDLLRLFHGREKPQ